MNRQFRHDEHLSDLACPCGTPHSVENDPPHGAVETPPEAKLTTEEHHSQLVDQALLRAVFPPGTTRRRLLKAMGATAAFSALSEVFPLAMARELFAQQGGQLEKKDLKIGFVPIVCATPIIMAHPLGFYSKHGLNVDVVKTPSWPLMRERAMSKEYDASHMLSPMPIAISLGMGSAAQPWTVPALENINGQAITLAMKHRNNRDPKRWKGMKFGVPFEYSMQNYLLRYYLAEHGLHPDTDVQILAVPPPQMVTSLQSGALDGYLGPEPFNQRAVYDGLGFIHLLSWTLWDGHPCCAFSTSREFIAKMPNTYRAVLKAVIDSTRYSRHAGNRKEIAEAIAIERYLNQPPIVVEQVLRGTFTDGLGNNEVAPRRIDFDPFPWQSFAIWILTQMQRWKQIKGDVNYTAIAERVFLTADAAKIMRELGDTPPTSTRHKFVIMGKEFDPAQAGQYLKGQKIRSA